MKDTFKIAISDIRIEWGLIFVVSLSMEFPFVRLQLNRGTIHPNCSIKMCNPFSFHENNTIIISTIRNRNNKIRKANHITLLRTRSLSMIDGVVQFEAKTDHLPATYLISLLFMLTHIPSPFRHRISDCNLLVPIFMIKYKNSNQHKTHTIPIHWLFYVIKAKPVA